MSKHTPGPWRVVDWRQQRSAPKMHVEAGDRTTRPTDWHRVCTLTTLHNGERIEANARLIAAAPEMLELLREGSTLLIVDGYASPNNPHPTFSAISALLREIDGEPDAEAQP